MLYSFFQNSFDASVAAQFLDMRSDIGVRIFALISFFGSWQFIVPATLIILLVLFIKKRKEFIFPFFLMMAEAELIVFFTKILFHRPRPITAVFLEPDFSFPSGHANIAVVFYGYLAYILIKSLKNKYKVPLVISVIIIAGLIGFSRLYLGVHYPTDVLVGYLIGSLLLIRGIFLTEYLSSRKARYYQP